MKHNSISRSTAAWLAATLSTASLAMTQDAVTTLESMVVTAESEADETNQQGWLPELPACCSPRNPRR
jgi:hypothetical protein